VTPAPAPAPPPRHPPGAAPGPRAHSRGRGPRPRDLGPEPLGHVEAFELQRLLGVPRLGHMRGQRADHAARGARPRSVADRPPSPARRAHAQAQATDRPNIPAPWTTIRIATPARLDEVAPVPPFDLDRPMVIDQPHDLDWRDGVPVSRRFDDPFYSLEDGLAEARHVFLGGNDLPRGSATGFISPSSASAPG
jgi:hypothetical protein